LKNKKRNKPSTPISFLKNNKVFYLLLLIIIPFIFYFRVVNFGFSGLDDSSIISNINNVIGNPLNLGEAFDHDAFMSDKGDTFYRPIQTISFMLDAQIGGKEPWIYHLANLILHIFTVIALLFFLKMTGIKEGISFLLTLLFSINPMLTNAVAWIPARGDILLCLFSLLSFITFIQYFKNRNTIFIILHAIVILMAVLSKETAVLLPLLILTYFYFVQKNKIQVKEMIPFLSIWLISFILFFTLRQSVIKVNHSSNVFGIIPFIENLPAIPITFGKFFFPYKLTSMPLFDEKALIIGFISLSIFIFLTIKVMRNRWRLAIWGFTWFLAFSIPPMFFRASSAIIGYEYFEYRTYLPIIGILFIIGLLVNEKIYDLAYKKIMTVSIPVILIYLGIALNYTSVFVDPVSFFTSAIDANSNNAMALTERGVALFDNKENDKALSDYDNAIKICPEYPPPYFNKGVLYGSLNDHYKAEYFFTEALKYDTLNKNANLLKENAYINLSHEKLFLHKYNDAVSILKKAIYYYPDNGSLHNYLGEAYFSLAKFDSSLFEFNKASESKKGSFKFYNNRGMARYHLNDYSGALYDFDTALVLKPDFPDTWINKGASKIMMSDYGGAISDLNIALSLDSKSGEAYYYRGTAYSKLNKMIEATKDWNEAMKLGYKEAIVENQKDE
jgi:protein O-mannosyl-transferase